MHRTKTKKIIVKNIQIGNQNKVIIQSMTNTKTSDIFKTIKQINELEKAGCQIVRLAILNKQDAYSIKEISNNTNIPLVADIHFDIELALICVDMGINKIRINPGNINDYDKLKLLINKCKKNKIPIRIGINSGSLEKEILKKYQHPTVEAMIESASYHVKLLEELNFFDICLSFKSSDVLLTINTYLKASTIFNYPLHIGLTEAGTFNSSSIRSTAALAPLLYNGIGDTIRISVSSEPIKELIIVKQLLNSFNLIDNVPTLISCPTCGRIQYDMIPIVEEIETYLTNINAKITVAIMGCPVNGPGEAASADIGIAGGKKFGSLFKKGKHIKNIPVDNLVEELKKEINLMIKNN